MCNSFGGLKMFTLPRWIKKRREERQLIKETEAREAQRRIQRQEVEAREAERRIQNEERDNQQAQALLLNLYELQRTMDPLVAVQVYNNRFCPFLSRLPEELLLCILGLLRDDVVALQCLRIVSRTFLRLLDRQSVVWKDLWHCGRPISSRGDASRLPNALGLQFRRLLQRDGRCDDCRSWNDCEQELFDNCKFQQNRRRRPHGGLFSSLYRRLYCYACHTFHDVYQFSSTYQKTWDSPWGYQPERRCLGQQGSVQLCEHMYISWASIKAHIDVWRQQQPKGGDWSAWIDSFNIECHDPSHDTRCTPSEAPTWPRARLHTSARDSIVVLNLEWTPHSRIDTIALTTDGRIPAPELRAQFQRLRRLGPADDLYPPSRPGALPEMACASSSSRLEPFIYYKTGENDKMEPPTAPFTPLPSEHWLRLFHRYGRGRNGKKLDIKPHYLMGASGTGMSSQCLVVSYQKDILVCQMTAITDPTVDIIPTDDWLHAMDTDTYSHPEGSHIRPQCRDETCINYFRRRRDYYFCSTWPAADYIPRDLLEVFVPKPQKNK